MSASRYLLLDAGNSRLKWLFWQAGQWLEQGNIRYADGELAQQMTQAWATLGPDRILLADVAGERIPGAIEQWQSQHAQHANLHIIRAESQAFGVNNAYDAPEKLGVDRWLGLLAARKHVQGSVCVVDAGTALTVDILSGEGQHLGGIIIPGIQLMLQSLTQNTDALQASVTSTAQGLGRDTQSALSAGTRAAACGAVLQVLEEARKQSQEDISTVVTGGDAEWLLSGLHDACQHEPHWVLKGLEVIAEGVS